MMTNCVIGKLNIQKHDTPPEEFIFSEKSTIRFGRMESNDIPLKDSKVSRFHAVIHASKTSIVLSDLSSLNGTFLNGRRISTPVSISSGDKIEIGSTKIEVQLQNNEDSDETDIALQTEAMEMQTVIVTILLADVYNYGKMSASLPNDDVTNMLQKCFNIVSKKVEDFGGTVDKYIGDCVMSLWTCNGLTEKDSAEQAIKCAFAIQNEMDNLISNNSWPYNDKHPWRLRFSINSGEALIGTIGGRKSREFTVLGDTVNVAFRLDALESRRKHELIISESTSKLIENCIPVNSLGMVDIEGKDAPIEIYTVKNYS
jgi:adenylate cyclase